MKDTKKPAAQSPFRRYKKSQKPLGAFRLINPGIASDAAYAMMAQDESPLAPWMTDRSLLPKKPPRTS
jgi:hypothetical protein